MTWKVHDLEFVEGEKLLLKVSLMKCVILFEKKTKLSSSFISPFDVFREDPRGSLWTLLATIHVYGSSIISRIHSSMV